MGEFSKKVCKIDFKKLDPPKNSIFTIKKSQINTDIIFNVYKFYIIDKARLHKNGIGLSAFIGIYINYYVHSNYM